MKLNETETRAMESEGYTCPLCKRRIGKGYCGPCDEFYNTGHVKDCPGIGERDNHQGHER
jgi:hypothetical protein